ncbi:FAD-dependent monooxygenase [Streptomyces sp. NRRL WC-3742]|uniref:FAD-dependent monooxygenase n=1 Tax=Streptomyces sp. NRRL WC-3742 TaxID=1463934 RepID=UPI00099D8B3E|nr:FAD-dependent monooxygenase [Streptomyces sp. NRRL WC-3742]
MRTAVSDPIIVVGAGPVGLTCALELARRGVPVRIVDRLAEPTTESRAIMVHARSLEMFERLGLVDELIRNGVRTTAMEMHSDGEVVARIALDLVDSPFPFSVTIAQTETERILTKALDEHGVSVEREVTLTGLTQDEHGVQAVLEHADGRRETVGTGWLVGADGGHSQARKLVGSALAGRFKGEKFLMGDVNADHELDPHSMYTFFSPHQGPLLVFPMEGDRLRLIANIATDDGRTATQEWLQQVVDERAERPIRIRDARWLTVFEVHHAQVPEYRVGRVLLVGDAAHVHSPAGGQGMNTGIQDAHNLAWKLALVHSGQAPATLLDSYHAERHPVGAQVIQFAGTLTRVGTLANPIAQKLRNKGMHLLTSLAPVRQAMADRTEETAVAYRKSPIVVQGRGDGKLHAGDHLPAAGPELRAALAAVHDHVLLTVAANGTAPAPLPGTTARQLLVGAAATAPTGYDAVFQDPDGLAAARYGLPNGGRIMVRPDGYVAAIAPLDENTPLHKYQALLQA